MKLHVNRWPALIIVLLCMPLLSCQPQSKGDAPSASTIEYTKGKGPESVEIRNVVFDLAGPAIPDRPMNERLVLRKITRTKEVLDEVGMEATTTIEAWPLGADFKEKPLYSITVEGIDPLLVKNELLVISRGLEDVSWWSVYKLGNGEHFFDTFIPLTQFSIRRDTQTLRYVGFEVPSDDVSDSRLKAPDVIGVLTYASAARVIREGLVTCDDPKLAQVLRSYFDAMRAIEFTGETLRLSISQNYPSAPKTILIVVPVTGDDLDFAHSQTPAGLHIVAWKR